MTIPVSHFIRGMHIHQAELLQEFDRRRKSGVSEYQSFFAEWARRHRKTTLAINLCIKEACRVPKSQYVHIAPTQVQARKMIWDDPNMLQAYLPDQREMAWKLNEQKMTVTFENGSIYIIGGADEPDSWRGTDAVGLVPDEWALMKPYLWTEIMRPVMAAELPEHIRKYQPFRWVFFLYTPKPEGTHATRMFDHACCLASGGTLPNKGRAEKLAPNTYASRLDGEISGIFTQSALNQYRKEVAEGIIPHAHYDQEVKCSRVTREEMVLITTEMIYELNHHWEGLVVPDRVDRKIVSIDPAWGGDVCQIMGLVNMEVKEEKAILDKMRESEIVMAAKLVARKIDTLNFIVDTVNAPGIADRLREDEAGYHVQEFKSSYRPTESEDMPNDIVYANLRAQAYHYTAQMIQTFTAGPIRDPELIRQLPLASRYTTQSGSGRLIIIPKLEVKKLLGCSPDKDDDYVMGVWGTQYVLPDGLKIVSRRSHRGLIPSAMG